MLKVEGKATTFRFVEPDPEPQVDPKAAKGKGRGAQNKAPAKGGAAQGGAR